MVDLGWTLDIYAHFGCVFKDGPQLILCATWPRRPAGYNNSIPIPHINLECYCCNQLACTAKLRTKSTEDRP